MTVALDDLGADRVGMETEGGEHLRLDLGAEVAVRPDRAGDLAGPDLVDGGRQAHPAALDLERPAGELEPERRRLGMDRVGPPHHHRGGFPASPGDEHGQQPVRVQQQPLPGRPQLEREPGIDDVAAGQTEVEIATLRADRFGDLADEGDDVVVGRALDLGDPLDIDLGTRLERGEGVGRDLAAGRLGAGDRELDAEHRLEPGGVRPDRAHLGERVARDHRAADPAVIGVGTPSRTSAAPMSWRRCRPGAWMRSAAASAVCRRSRQVAPATDDREDPAAGRSDRSVGVARGPGVEDERSRCCGLVEAVDPVARARRIRVARGRQHDRDGRPGECRETSAGQPGRCESRPQVAARGGEQDRTERDRQPRQDGLRLGVAEARVALEQDWDRPR